MKPAVRSTCKHCGYEVRQRDDGRWFALAYIDLDGYCRFGPEDVHEPWPKATW